MQGEARSIHIVFSQVHTKEKKEMFSTLEKDRFGNDTRKLALQVWLLREDILKSSGDKARWANVGPAADLLRAYQVLSDSAARWEAK